jgi:hypothetical protein
MRLRSVSGLWVLLTLFLSGATASAPVPPTAEAPLSGRVTQPDGEPVVAALVTYTGEGGVGVRATRTGVDGRFQLVRPGPVGSAGRLTVERMGYADVERRVAGNEQEVSLVLEPEPLPLPGFQVSAEGATCPPRDDPDARRAWEAMARLHPAGLDTVGVASYTLALSDTLPEGTMVPVPGSLNSRTPGQRGSAPLLRLSWSRRVQREGYAFPVRRTDAIGSFDSWSYAPLEADFSSHFASPEFGRLTRFQFATRDDGEGGSVLRFCSTNARRPGLEGRLELSPDTTLIRAEWRFRTDDPDEDAGGWARFPSYLDSGPPPLLPLESMTWRKIRGGAFQRRAQWYEDWLLAPGDSVPILPDRSGAEGWDEVPW